MNRWESLSSKGLYAQADFRRAALGLMTRQALYRSDMRDKVSYDIVRSHLTAFREVFAHFGMDIRDEPAEQYLVAIPVIERPNQLSTEMTLLVLTLRQIYEQAMRNAQIDGVDAVVTIDELRTAFRTFSNGRELPQEASALKELLSQARRMGMAAMRDPELGSDQPFDVAVRPGIKTLVSEPVLARFASYYQTTGKPDAAEPAESAEDAEEGEHEKA